ncbi:hypothetical protein PM082_015173 [Marasmius tenuissimus]|nr:hypothetical protein PM082_015173 [Marasmius tenuissimus]
MSSFSFNLSGQRTLGSEKSVAAAGVTIAVIAAEMKITASERESQELNTGVDPTRD